MPAAPDRAITVVIPTYCRRKRLQDAVESVLSETRVPIRLHVFDNASPDDTEAYVRGVQRTDRRIEYSRSDTNLGARTNYIRAFSSIDTAYYVPLADDDRLLPDFLFDAFQILEKHPEAGAAIFVTQQLNEAGELMTTYPGALDRIQFGLLTPQQHLRDWMSHGHYGWSSILWRRETLDALGYPYVYAGRPSDVDFQAQIFCHFPVYLTNKPGAVYQTHSTQASNEFSVLDIPSWATLFRRLDHKVSKLGIFERDEYLQLRKAMLNKFRVTWRRRADMELTDKQIVGMAASAGFRLDDWDLAYQLLDRLDRQRFSALPATPRAQQFFALPGSSATDSHFVAGDLRSLLTAIMLRFRNSDPAADKMRGDVSPPMEAVQTSTARVRNGQLARLLIRLGVVKRSD